MDASPLSSPDSITRSINGVFCVAFKSGVIAAYEGMGLASYNSFCAAPSKGQWMHAHGLGPKHAPIYRRVAPTPDQILFQQPVASSWCTHAYLIDD